MLMLEKYLESIIAKYSELIEKGLELKGRQVNIEGKIIDLLFVDNRGQELIVELKKGAVSRKDIGQLMDYAGRLLPKAKKPLRVMLIGTRVPKSMQHALDYYGIEWQELSLNSLKAFLSEKKDQAMLSHFHSSDDTIEEPSIKIPHGNLLEDLKQTFTKRLPELRNMQIEGAEVESFYHSKTRKNARELHAGKVFSSEEKKSLIAINEAKRRYYEVAKRNPANYSSEEKQKAKQIYDELRVAAGYRTEADFKTAARAAGVFDSKLRH